MVNLYLGCLLPAFNNFIGLKNAGSFKNKKHIKIIPQEIAKFSSKYFSQLKRVYFLKSSIYRKF